MGSDPQGLGWVPAEVGPELGSDKCAGIYQSRPHKEQVMRLDGMLSGGTENILLDLQFPDFSGQEHQQPRSSPPVLAATSPPRLSVLRSPPPSSGPWGHLFPAVPSPSHVGSVTSLCPHRMFENHSLREQGCPTRQTSLVLYMPNNPEKQTLPA